MPDEPHRPKLCIILPWLLVIILVGMYMMDRLHFHFGGEKWLITYNEEPLEALHDDMAKAGGVPDPGIPLGGSAKAAERHARRVPKTIEQLTTGDSK